jgi:hypothetical protein
MTSVLPPSMDIVKPAGLVRFGPHSGLLRWCVSISYNSCKSVAGLSRFYARP